jgi:hypothetical protein
MDVTFQYILFQTLPSAPPAGASGPVDLDCTMSDLRVRCEDGAIVRRVFDADAPMSMVAAMVAELRPAGAGAFVLRVPFPRREFGTAAELGTSLRAAGLAPRGTLLVLPESARGVVRRAGPDEEDAPTELGMQMQMLQQLLAEMPVGGGGGPGGGYEAMLAYEARMSEVATGLSVAQIARLPTRSVEQERDDCTNERV